MKGYACSNCGAKPQEKVKPPSMVKRLCPVCGKPLVIKISDTEITVTAKLNAIPQKHKTG